MFNPFTFVHVAGRPGLRSESWIFGSTEPERGEKTELAPWPLAYRSLSASLPTFGSISRCPGFTHVSWTP